MLYQVLKREKNKNQVNKCPENRQCKLLEMPETDDPREKNMVLYIHLSFLNHIHLIRFFLNHLI